MYLEEGAARDVSVTSPVCSEEILIEVEFALGSLAAVRHAAGTLQTRL